MAAVEVLNSDTEKVSEIELPDSIFNVAIKNSVLHQVVKMQLARRRSGSASVKHRSEIKGSGRKLFRQKGTGRARRGNIKSPLLRGGGSVFGPDIRNYNYSIPKKIRLLAFKMALSFKQNKKAITVIKSFDLLDIGTKKLKKIIDSFGFVDTLIIIDKKNQILELSARNIPNVKILRADGLNVYDILKFRNIVLLTDTIKQIQRRLSNEKE